MKDFRDLLDEDSRQINCISFKDGSVIRKAVVPNRWYDSRSGEFYPSLDEALKSRSVTIHPLQT